MGLELDKMETLGKLEPFFRYGMSIRKAVNAHNSKTNFKDYISVGTILDWYTKLPQVHELIDAWRESGEVLAHKTWIDAMKLGNYQAAREWLKVKSPEDYGDKDQTDERIIIEFASTPSPFVAKTAKGDVVVPPDLPQTKNFKEAAVKKKSVKKRQSAKPSTKSPVQKKSSGTKKGGATAKESKPKQ